MSNGEVKEFLHPYVTVDVLIFSIVGGDLSVLLIRRSSPPHQKMFAVPGVFVQMDESLDEAASRAISTKGGLSRIYLEQLYSFGRPDRDSRGRVVSVSYFALVPEDKITRDEGGEHVVRWFPVMKLPKLAFDHNQIVEMGIGRLRSKLAYSSIAVGLMPKSFSLSELQRTYELILGETIDKRNFRKKITSLDLLQETGREVGKRRRPAVLYSFKKDKPVFFD